MIGRSNAGTSDLDRAFSSLDKVHIGYLRARRLPTPKRHRPEVAMKTCLKVFQASLLIRYRLRMQNQRTLEVADFLPSMVRR